MLKFIDRHIGPSEDEINLMLDFLGKDSLDDFCDDLIPPQIKNDELLDIASELSEEDAIKKLSSIASKNLDFKSLIGQGYYGTILPPVLQRNILENPGWYSGYTPYQAEISQGRLEALFNFQTMISDLTGLPISNASLLDEPTAVAEAIILSHKASKKDTKEVFISNSCHPQIISVARSRCDLIGLNVIIGDAVKYKVTEKTFAAVVQYPDTNGLLFDYKEFAINLNERDALLIVAADLLALTLYKEPSLWGADIVVGSTQRFGCPVGFGGPHAAFFATKDDFKRLVPGRIVGRSKDRSGNYALRLAMQTREQHIRREKATSNICTAQVLPAVIASMYAVYHGAKNLKEIAKRINCTTNYLVSCLRDNGYNIDKGPRFDTIKIILNDAQKKIISKKALIEKINLRYYSDGCVGISLDETLNYKLISALGRIFDIFVSEEEMSSEKFLGFYDLERKSNFLEHPTFNKYRSELEITRYLHSLSKKDLTLADSMIPLGSCTMKLNAASELEPISWTKFNSIHPYVPQDQVQGYKILIDNLTDWLSKITGFSKISLQPNSGASGEYAGLVAIRSYHESRNNFNRNICLIPESAHGTNPASAILSGFQVISINCKNGCVDIDDLKQKVEEHKEKLGVFMLTYPSTYGIYEYGVKDICSLIHKNGGQVYLDGANMNAMVGLCKPGAFGADVCHLNLHKTFCIPHGGGGPGVGPIGVAEHLVNFLPSDPCLEESEFNRPVSGANYGSASILPISWMYIQMMGARGLKKASQVAILNSNYLIKRLSSHYPVLYQGDSGLVAHEGIIDLRTFKKDFGIDVDDICKRLIDYGFHAPTMSWPVVGTIMIEPTESETLEELDRFCDALISIRKEIKSVELGKFDPKLNVLKNAPFTIQEVSSDEWPYPFSRREAAWPDGLNKNNKFWPSVSRIDNAFGDRNLVCTCPTVEDYNNLKFDF